MSISLGDNVRVVETPLTTGLGLAGRVGQVYGETTPSVTGVDVVGDVSDDYAVAVQLDLRHLHTRSIDGREECRPSTRDRPSRAVG